MQLNRPACSELLQRRLPAVLAGRADLVEQPEEALAAACALMDRDACELLQAEGKAVDKAQGKAEGKVTKARAEAKREAASGCSAVFLLVDGGSSGSSGGGSAGARKSEGVQRQAAPLPRPPLPRPSTRQGAVGAKAATRLLFGRVGGGRCVLSRAGKAFTIYQPELQDSAPSADRQVSFAISEPIAVLLLLFFLPLLRKNANFLFSKPVRSFRECF